MKYKVKIITGFRRDQEHSIPAEEAHKAYYLFFNPDARSVFSTGLAIKGSEIQEVMPDYQGTMGWNADHYLKADDWAEIRKAGVQEGMLTMLAAAKYIANLGDATDLNVPLPELVEKKYPRLNPPKTT